MKWNDEPTPEQIAADEACLNAALAPGDARLVAHAGESLAAADTYDEATKAIRGWSPLMTTAEINAAVRYAWAIRKKSTVEGAAR